MPKVGDTQVFVPTAWSYGMLAGAKAKIALKGTVVYVNEEHRYYTVEARHCGYAVRESYKF